jgi:pimeloyl-ACP methyl ester carboxylesterase
VSAPLDTAVLPEGVAARIVPGVNGLDMHVLEAGARDAPCVLLLHGFPELGFSWRHVLRPLAHAGFRVVAPDQRGYGRTGPCVDFADDVAEFRFTNLVQDALTLVHALGHRDVAAVVGHDFGAPVAAWCALIRPDVFRSVVLMSAPFTGPPPLNLTDGAPAAPSGGADRMSLQTQLAALDPPRMHYQAYFSSARANADMLGAPQGLHAFLRAYFHSKSGDWPMNRPFPLRSLTARELARLPPYYVMPYGASMPQVVAPLMPSLETIAECRWLTEGELAIYRHEFARTGFQGGLNWYRSAGDARARDELRLFAGRTIDVPACFIAGRSDWGVHQLPGALERMQHYACTDLRACELIDGAGHWVQQERPEAVVSCLIAFLRECAPRQGL